MGSVGNSGPGLKGTAQVFFSPPPIRPQATAWRSLPTFGRSASPAGGKVRWPLEQPAHLRPGGRSCVLDSLPSCTLRQPSALSHMPVEVTKQGQAGSSLGIGVTPPK